MFMSLIFQMIYSGPYFAVKVKTVFPAPKICLRAYPKIAIKCLKGNIIMYKYIRICRFFSSFLFGLLFLAFGFVSFSPAIALAAQVTLTWDENSEENLAGYRVFCRQAGLIDSEF